MRGLASQPTAQELGKYWSLVYQDASPCKDLELYFATFNGQGKEENPLANMRGQLRLKELGVSHTSMSVGDIIEINGACYFCDNEGWTELK